MGCAEDKVVKKEETCGGFLRMLLLLSAWLIKGQTIKGILGISLFAIAIILIVVLSPWKHSETKYWKLILPIYRETVILELR